MSSILKCRRNPWCVLTRRGADQPGRGVWRLRRWGGRGGWRGKQWGPHRRRCAKRGDARPGHSRALLRAWPAAQGAAARPSASVRPALTGPGHLLCVIRPLLSRQCVAALIVAQHAAGMVVRGAVLDGPRASRRPGRPAALLAPGAVVLILRHAVVESGAKCDYAVIAMHEPDAVVAISARAIPTKSFLRLGWNADFPPCCTGQAGKWCKSGMRRSGVVLKALNIQ